MYIIVLLRLIFRLGMRLTGPGSEVDTSNSLSNIWLFSVYNTPSREVTEFVGPTIIR
jgi:hypothetical protein